MSLTFRIEMRPHAPGYDAPWIVHDDGRRRRATDEEVLLWDELQQVVRMSAPEQLPGLTPGARPTPVPRRKS